jgi:hypothetical protein
MKDMRHIMPVGLLRPEKFFKTILTLHDAFG